MEDMEDLPDVKLSMPWLQQQRFFQVLLDNMDLSLIIDVLQQLIGIMGYQNTSTCCSKPKPVRHSSSFGPKLQQTEQQLHIKDERMYVMEND